MGLDPRPSYKADILRAQEETGWRQFVNIPIAMASLASADRSTQISDSLLDLQSVADWLLKTPSSEKTELLLYHRLSPDKDSFLMLGGSQTRF